ncbi:transposase family protein [Methylobacter sp. BBA5.1]|uniref:transposase family protein n=1 Tax=Methylobacter sp. BBA5.1 TaxID=1495064 RepID=UPI00126899C9
MLFSRAVITNGTGREVVDVGTLYRSGRGPRTRQSPHDLMELLLTAICAVLSGADSGAGMALWRRTKLSWLRQFLPFANGPLCQNRPAGHAATGTGLRDGLAQPG